MNVKTKLEPPTLLDIYRKATLIRRNDDRIQKVIRAGRLVMPHYSTRGQEIIPAAVSMVLTDADYICTTYRGLHDSLAKGMPLNELWAELAGRATGTCKGKGGPMHITYPKKGIMVTTGIVGSAMPIANGLAWASQLSGDKRVVVANFGDGAANIGAFHEALNLAGLWRLPVVFVCQNNLFGEHTAYANATAVERIATRAAGYSMPGYTVDGNDPEAMVEVTRVAVERARAGQGATLIEAVTFRLLGHVLGDECHYMDPTERAAAIAADPVPRLRQRLLDEAVASEDELHALEQDIEKQLDAAVEFAFASPTPDLRELNLDVFANAGA